MKVPHHDDELMMTSSIDKQYEDEEALEEAYAGLYKAAKILERSYKKVTLEECTLEQDYMTAAERTKFNQY